MDIAQDDNRWIYDLARAEAAPTYKVTDPRQLVEESAVGMLQHLRGHMSQFAKVFSSLADTQPIKVYSLAQAAADFMLYRNQVKLICSHVQQGVIQFSFAHHQKISMSIDAAQVMQSPLGQESELLAEIGPFRQVLWTFRGEKVSCYEVARFYFSEFVEKSRDEKKVSHNEQLLEHIKTLLHQKNAE